MSPALTTFLFEAANLLILAVVLSWFLFTPIRNALEARRAVEEEQVRKAQEKLKEAERVRSEIDDERRKLSDERDRILKQAQATAEKQSEAVLLAARESANRQRAAAMREMSALTENQLNRLASAAATAAAAAVEKLLQTIDSANLQQQLVEAACRELSSLSGKLGGPITVESASALQHESTARLNEVMGDSAKSVEYRVNPEIGAGLRIQTSQGVIDLTAAGFAAYARRALETGLAPRDGRHEHDEAS